MSLHIEQNTFSKQQKIPPLYLAYSLTCNSWLQLYLNSREYRKHLLKLLHHKGFTGPQIAETLSISLPLVKKYKKELNLRKIKRV